MESTVKFNIPCGQGYLQITDEGYLQNTTIFGRVSWSLPAKNVGGISSARKVLSLVVTIETPSGKHTVTGVSSQNYDRLRTALAEFQS